MDMSQWMACNEPWEMLVFLEPRASDRKLQLFAAACCRRAWSIGPDRRHEELVEAAERFANGWLSEAEFERCREAVIAMREDNPDEEPWSPSWCLTSATLHARGGGAARYAARFVANGLAVLAGEQESEAWHAALHDEMRHQCEILRDVIGDPFRPFRFDPSWLSHEGRPAQRMAEEMEESGRYDELGRLADVLEQNGCKDLAVLEHCRRASGHVPGCWVIDALLGRESSVAIGLTTEAGWRDCDDPASLLHFLREKGTARRWRLFEVACCRRIEQLITDDRCRGALQAAARHAVGKAGDEELERARIAAQAAEDEASKREWVTEAEEQSCSTPRYCDAGRDMFVASAVRSAVCRDVRCADAAPGTPDAEQWSPSHRLAPNAIYWHVCGTALRVEAATRENAICDPSLSSEDGQEMDCPYQPEAKESLIGSAARRAELKVQCDILRDLFGEFFGPLGTEGMWMPRRSDAPGSEWWCLLPTPKRAVVRPEWLEWSGGVVPRLAEEILSGSGFDRLPLLAEALERAGCEDPVILGHLRSRGTHYPGCWVLELLLGQSRPESDSP
ncbi:hypothetical protein OJF2_30300 [Aquisphaera giovannonii]|uniref:Uncharacterized protein n=1 Tax=Aquisphaera giovannonii TaxID=406548 RepID=A0A5B9W328_9BACT|nr:hypothetical protein [Aquisphaera giovannonii]QEH34491.1 hypothetical protein OJF2_30300 [Aquisphaera giovannonii]